MPPDRPGSAPRLLGGALAFAGGFLAACALLSRFVDPTPVDGGRIDWVRTHGADFDTFVVGSSRTARQLVPSVFDAAMAAGGRPTRSFNLGMPGMRPPEDDYVIERALAGRTAPLRFLIAESNPVQIGLAPQDRETARAVYWHDARRMRTLWRRAFAPSSIAPEGAPDDEIVKQNVRALADHARHWLWNATRLGRGAELLQEATLAPRAPRRRDPLGPAGDGFVPRPPGEVLAGEELERYRREMEAVVEEPPSRRYGDAESQAELLRKRDLAARHGGRLVLVVPPYLTRPFAPLPAHGTLFLDFSDPRRYPELFAADHRSDFGHLNQRGAELYSRLLARELLAALAAEAAP